nr:MAG TPA: Regulatory protein [Caudoviricetes sp.]
MRWKILQTSYSRAWKAEVKKRMILRGWTYRDLARETGFSKSVIDRYMTGSYSNDKPRERIERALGME